MTITYCENSTIAEAWGVIWGLPARLDDTDAAVLLRAARERIHDLQQKPVIVAVNPGPDLTPPFWREQVVWDGEQYVARFGHRYLSVHFVRQGEKRYETFETSMKPALDTWIDMYGRSLANGADVHPVDRIAYGYVNAFEFDPEGFDLSRFFKMNFGVKLGGGTDGLDTIDTGCTFVDRGRDAHLSVNLQIRGPSDGAANVRVITKVMAEKRALEGVSYADRAQIDAILLDAKSAAKDTFFDFATGETHAIMGAVNDAPA